MVKTFEEFINENLDVLSFRNFRNYKYTSEKDTTVDPQKIVEKLELLDYDGELKSAPIRNWLYETYGVKFICVQTKDSTYDYFFSKIRENKIPKSGEERYDKSKDLCYIVSEYNYKNEDVMFMENLLEGLDWLIEILYNPDNPDFEHSIVDDPVDYTQYYNKVKESIKRFKGELV